MHRNHLVTAEIDPLEPPLASIVWLHGLGAPWDFVDFPPRLALPDDLPVRFVFPQAPTIPVTLNNGWAMPAWYDVISLERGSQQDERGIRENAARLELLLEREKKRGVPAHRIVLAGFSQGGALALFTGLRHHERLGGIIALSSYGLLHESFPEEGSEACRTVPIFQAHGTRDPMVPIDAGRGTAEGLKALGYQVTWGEYPVEHGLDPQEEIDIREWLVGVIAAMGGE